MRANWSGSSQATICIVPVEADEVLNDVGVAIVIGVSVVLGRGEEEADEVAAGRLSLGFVDVVSVRLGVMKVIVGA